MLETPTWAQDETKYMYIYELKFFDSIESWPELFSNPRPRAYRAYAITTELSGRTMRSAYTPLNDS